MDKNTKGEILVLPYDRYYKSMNSKLEIQIKEGTLVFLLETDENLIIADNDDILLIDNNEYIHLLQFQKTKTVSYSEYMSLYREKANTLIADHIIDISPDPDTPMSRLAKLGVRFS